MKHATIRKILLTILLNTSTVQANKEQIHDVAAINWCPQVCPKSEKKGYILEIFEEITKTINTEFKVNEYPWSRAIKYVKNGTSLALLAPAKEEAPTLIYPSIPIGIQEMCFFVKENSDWNYTGLESLRHIVVGIANDTSIEELNQFAKENPATFQVQPYHERFISQNINKLFKNRIDTFIFTRNSTLYEIKRLGLKEQVRIAGCVSAAPVYVGFSSAQHLIGTSTYMVDRFDTSMLELMESNKIDEILLKYDVGFTSVELLKYVSKNK